MKSKSHASRALTVFCFLALTSTTVAHTWLENLRLIASNGTFVGAPGFPRAYIDRNKGNGNDNVFELPATPPSFLASDKMCKQTQTVGTQTNGYPRLKAAPKDHVALRYEENGHVSQFVPKGRSLGRGTVFIYGTKSPSNSDTYLAIHRVWNTDGTGGDKRGKLLAAQPFDDGRCFQNNPANEIVATRAKAVGTTASNEVFCQNNIQIPDDAGTSGMYTLYWVWEWPRLFTNGNIQLNQSYTSCVDIDLTSSPVADAGAFKAQQTGANINSVAIEAQFKTAIMVNPTAAPQVAPDDLGDVQPGGIQGTAKAPAAGATTSARVASSATQSPKASTSTSTTKKASSPSGFVTVTVAVPTTIATTVTVFMPAQTPSPSTSYKSTVYVVSMTTKSNTAAAKATGGVFVSVAPSSSVSKAKVNVAVSTESGKYSTNTAVPTPRPFLGSKGTIRRRRFE